MERYERDADGQWWCFTKRQRLRVQEQTCGACRRVFLNRHPQKFCSKTCLGISQRGRRVMDRPCASCGKAFMPTGPGRGIGRKTCSAECATALGNKTRGLPGPEHPNWKGGTKRHAAGYIQQWAPGRGQVLQHRLVMEEVLGRRLLPSEQVHHKNGIRDDNRPENLELWITKQPPGQRPNERQHCPTCRCFLD